MPAEKMAREIMTVGDLATYLHCHQSTIYRLLRIQALPAFKVGSDWRFMKDDIERWCQRAQKARLRAAS